MMKRFFTIVFVLMAIFFLTNNYLVSGEDDAKKAQTALQTIQTYGNLFQTFSGNSVEINPKLLSQNMIQTISIPYIASTYTPEDKGVNGNTCDKGDYKLVCPDEGTCGYKFCTDLYNQESEKMSKKCNDCKKGCKTIENPDDCKKDIPIPEKVKANYEGETPKQFAKCPNAPISECENYCPKTPYVKDDKQLVKTIKEQVETLRSTGPFDASSIADNEIKDCVYTAKDKFNNFEQFLKLDQDTINGIVNDNPMKTDKTHDFVNRYIRTKDDAGVKIQGNIKNNMFKRGALDKKTTKQLGISDAKDKGKHNKFMGIDMNAVGNLNQITQLLNGVKGIMDMMGGKKASSGASAQQAYAAGTAAAQSNDQRYNEFPLATQSLNDETSNTPAKDNDGDGILNNGEMADSDDNNSKVCGDFDNDGCEDCAGLDGSILKVYYEDEKAIVYSKTDAPAGKTGSENESDSDKDGICDKTDDNVDPTIVGTESNCTTNGNTDCDVESNPVAEVATQLTSNTDAISQAEEKVDSAEGLAAATGNVVNAGGYSFYVDDDTISSGQSNQNYRQIRDDQKVLVNTDGSITISDATSTTTHIGCFEGINFGSSQMIFTCGDTEIVNKEIFLTELGLFGPGTARFKDGNVKIDNSMLHLDSMTMVTTLEETNNLISGAFFGFFGSPDVKINLNSKSFSEDNEAYLSLNEIKAQGSMDIDLVGDKGLLPMKVRQSKLFGSSVDKNSITNVIIIPKTIEDSNYKYTLIPTSYSTQVYDQNNNLIQENSPEFLRLDAFARKMIYK